MCSTCAIGANDRTARRTKSAPDWFPHQDDGRVPGHEVLLQDQHARELGVDAHLLTQPCVLVWHDVLADASERGVQVTHDLLAADHQDELPGRRRVGTHLAAGRRGLHQLAGFGHGVDASELDVRRGDELADLPRLRGAIHLEVLLAEEVMAVGLHELFEHSDVLERLRLRGVNLRALGKALHDRRPGRRGVLDDDRLEVALPESGGQRLELGRRGSGGEVGDFGAQIHFSHNTCCRNYNAGKLAASTYCEYRGDMTNAVRPDSGRERVAAWMNLQQTNRVIQTVLE